MNLLGFVHGKYAIRRARVVSPRVGGDRDFLVGYFVCLMASNKAAALSRVSWYSSSALESTTIAPPA